MPGIESEFVSCEYDTSLILTPENINRNATIVSATNPFKMRIQKKKTIKEMWYIIGIIWYTKITKDAQLF